MNSNHKKFLSIRVKMFIQLSAIFLAAVTVILIINTLYLNDIYLYNKKQDMKEIADRINYLDIQSGIYFGTVKDLESQNNVSIDIYDSNGSELYVGSELILNSADGTQILEHSEKKDGSFFEIQETGGNQYIFYHADLSFGGEIEIYSYKSDVDSNASVALTFTWGSAFLIFIISLVSIYMYTRKFTKPLIKMNDITEKMSKMDFSEKCEVASKDEIGHLSESINHLSDSLDTTLNDLNEKNKRLSDDIEKKNTLDQLRKEFISSISHELKTPIAIIKGYAEGAEVLLESGETDNALEYCGIIIKESEKMNALVYELLELSRYELGDNRLDSEKFELKSFIDAYTDSAKIVFKDNNITLRSEIKDGIICFGDVIKLTMVLNNYISNAVSHIGGERIIKITAEESDTICRVNVFNSGENIKDEDIDKIWNSFYRADKSRSRKEGRFGLGLSTVVAIQNLHSMGYGVRNEENGVTFWFDISKGNNT